MGHAFRILAPSEFRLSRRGAVYVGIDADVKQWLQAHHGARITIWNLYLFLGVGECEGTAPHMPIDLAI